MPVFLGIVGAIWLAFGAFSFATWASIMPANIMQQLYQQNLLLMAVVQVSFAVVFFAAASIISKLGRASGEQAPDASEPEPAKPDARLRVRPVS